MGKIELDHTGSGSGITLSSDGTDLLLDGTAVGGTALELYAENPSSPTAPSATGTNSVAIGTGSISSGSTSVAIGDRTEATANQTVAIGSLNTRCSSIQGVALGSARASGLLGSVAIGGYGSGYSVASNNYSIALGRSYSSGDASFAAAIANNTSSYGATGANSVAIGGTNKATGTGGLALGRNAISTAQDAVSIGLQCTADATNSIALGAYSSTKGIKGRIAFSGVSSNYQQGTFVLAKQTADATPSVLTYNTAGASTDNQVILPNNSAYGFTGTVIAREDSSSTDDFAVWEIKGGAVRGASASTTALGSYNINKISESTGAANWSIALSADTTNGAVAITVTGEAAHNIRWVATVNTTEVTY